MEDVEGYEDGEVSCCGISFGFDWKSGLPSEVK